MIIRRKLLIGCGAGICAPAIVRAQTLMELGAGSTKKPSGGGVAFSLAFTDHQENDAIGSNPVTFTALGIGTADTNRIVGIGIQWRAQADTDTVTMTIGGISGTQVTGAKATRSDSLFWLANIFYAAVPTGTTADIVCTFGGNAALRAGVAGYRIITVTSTPTNSGQITAGAGVTNLNISETVPASGGAMTMYGARAGTAPIAWTNATKDYEATTTDVYSSAHLTSSASVTATDSGGGNGNAMNYAAWGP